MTGTCNSASHCYRTRVTKRCIRPNPWLVFLRTHKGKFANKQDMLANYKDDFQIKMAKKLSIVEDKSWTNKRKREEYQKILCRYFHEKQKISGKDSQKNKDGIRLAVGDVLKRSSSTRASLSAIKKMKPAAAEKAKKAKRAKETEKKKKNESVAKKSPGPHKPPKVPPVHRALLRLVEDLRTPPKKTRFGGVAGRSGRHQVKRVLYDPTSPSKPKSKKVKKVPLKPIRSTIEERQANAQKNVKGASELKPKTHQKTVLEFMKNVADPSKNKKGKYANTKGLLVAHGMGSGKTLTSLWVAKELLKVKRVDFVNIVAPNVSVPEFLDSFEKAGINPAIAGKVRVLTHDEFAYNKKERRFGNSLVIVDEAHLFTKTKYDALVKFDVPYIMLLSGTPAPNTTCDIVPLINLLCKKKEHQMTKAKWNGGKKVAAARVKFLKDKVSMHNIGPKNNYMGKVGKGKIDSKNEFPGFRVKTVRVKLSCDQEKRYKALNKEIKREPQSVTDKHPLYTRERKIVLEHPDRLDGRVTPKIARVAEDVVKHIKGTKNRESSSRLSRGRVLVYVYNTDVKVDLVNEIKRLCGVKKIANASIECYNGKTSESERNRIKESFNGGETDVLIISKAGSVGLDLQCTSKVFMLDVSWNIPQMNQIIGRAIRFKSHDETKTGCKHRHVDVYICKSVFRKKQKKVVRVFDDTVLRDSVKKWKLVAKMIEKVMKKASIKKPTAEKA